MSFWTTFHHKALCEIIFQSWDIPPNIGIIETIEAFVPKVENKTIEIAPIITNYDNSEWFSKKYKKPRANESQPHRPGAVYEAVLSTDIQQQEQTLELEQNVAYAPINTSY